MITSSCQYPIADNCLCGSPTPRREAYCDFHSEIAAIQRKADVSNRAGTVGVKAEWRLGVELAKIPKAKGTRGQFAGKVFTGDSKSETPVKNPRNLPAAVALPSSDAPTLAELGMLDRKQAARAQKLATLSPEKIDETVAETVAESAGVSLADLDAGMCRWIIDDDFNYCGAKADERRPYCPSHANRAYL
jgi:hypothetical protein